MKDVREILLKGLIPALQTATSLSVYTTIPKKASPVYPYIYVSDMYQEENGSKTSKSYKIDLLVRVIYKDVKSLSGLFGSINNVLSIINNGKPFEIGTQFYIESGTLISSSMTTELIETGKLEIGLVRLLFKIEQN